MSETFVNPYNFISLPKDEDVKKFRKEYAEKVSEKKSLTGKLVCHLIPKTEIIIPDHEEMGKKKGKDAEGKEVYYEDYPFMTMSGQPMIPGSSIRGMIRSIHEILTYSCMFLNDDYYFSSRSSPKEPGLIQKTEKGYKLHEAVRYADKYKKVDREDRTGKEIKFKGEERGGRKYVESVGEGAQGYVLKMKPFIEHGKSSAHSVFVKGGVISECLSEKTLKAFDENIKKYEEGDAYKEIPIKKHEKRDTEKNDFAMLLKNYKSKWESLKPGEFLPVWYEKGLNNEFYLAPSQISRNVYMNKPLDLLPKSLHKCKEKKYLCPTCTLFGFVASEGKEDAFGSRIRVTDARCENKEALEEESILLPILSSPRTSSLEFYLRGKGNSYNADTVEKNGKPAVELSGRKVYWHHNEFNPKELKGEQNPNLTSYMQYINRREGLKFQFEVYFDGISKRELEQLYTALTFGENVEDGRLCHKVGHGKPLGFGSAKIVVDKIITREFDIKSDNSYTMERMDIEELQGISLPLELVRVADFCSEAVLDQTIDYPRLKDPRDPRLKDSRYKDDDKIYKWFSKNRPLSSNKQVEFRTKLPEILPKTPEDSVAQFRNPEHTKRSGEQKEASNSNNKFANQRDFSPGKKKNNVKDNSKNVGTNMGDILKNIKL